MATNGDENASEVSDEEYYLGFDLSTQSFKAVITNKRLEVVYETGVKFDKDLPEFRTSGGANRDTSNVNSKVVTAQPIMWVKAVDLVMEKLRVLDPPFHKIVGISGAAQQHGSVYWRSGSKEMLNNLDPEKFLHEQLAFAFSIQHSPIWMDSSTTEYCEMLEKSVGGPQALAKITGSRAYERFTANQIAKIFHLKREAYNHTERISLVSSFAASIFLGDYAPIDYSDGSGMNLLDIKNKCWSKACIKGCTSTDSNLEERLGNPVPSESVVGNISRYFVERYGFNPECKVIAFTGDNPSSFAEMCLGPTDIAVSLGTSDTLFLSLPELPDQGLGEGHVFINPINSKESYMGLLCFRNGSLTRERIKKGYSDDSWKIFNQLLDMCPRGNFGNIGFYFDLWEIIPKIKNGDHKFNKEDKSVPKFSSCEAEVRALIEGQFLSRRLHAEKMGCRLTLETKILATGGASSNTAILQVLSDVFNVPVFVQQDSDSADLGACYRIKHVLYGQDKPFKSVIGDIKHYEKICQPNKDSKEIYDKMLHRYAALEAQILSSS